MNLLQKIFGPKGQIETPASTAGVIATVTEGNLEMLMNTGLKSKTENGGEPLFSASATERRRAEAVYDSWIKRLKRNGQFSEITKITPALAEVLMERNSSNRRLSKHGLRRLAADMKDGNFQLNGEAVVIADTGELNDGQHRLQACIESGVSFDTVVVVGMSRESRETLDQGVRRTPGQQLTMMGYRDGNNVAHAGRVYWQMVNHGRVSQAPEFTPTWPQILEIIEEHQDLTQTAYGHRAWKAKLGGVGLHVAMRLWCANTTRVMNTERFFDSLVTGLGLQKTDPAYQVRKRLIEGDRLTEVERAAFILKGWNAFRNGDRIKSLRFVAGEDFPVAE